MSTDEDESKIKKNNLGKIEIEIDRTEEMKELQNQNNELKTTLQLLAEKEFQAKCKAHGLNPENTSVEDLEKIMSSETKRAPRGNSEETTNFYSQGQQTGKAEPIKVDSEMPPSCLEFDSTEQAISTLNKLKKEGSPQQKKEATVLLSKLEKKAFSKNKVTLDAEFEGDIHSLTRHEIPIRENMTNEEKQRVEEYNQKLRKERSNWVQKE